MLLNVNHFSITCQVPNRLLLLHSFVSRWKERETDMKHE